MASVILVAVALAACGRATDEEIDQALGITPTPTPSSEQLARATAAASAAAAARAGAQASPGGAAGELALGDVQSGSRQFQTWCSACHAPGGSGPNLLAVGGPGVGITYDQLRAVVRDGTGHPNPPGPFKATEISDKRIRDIGAYILSKAAP